MTGFKLMVRWSQPQRNPYNSLSGHNPNFNIFRRVKWIYKRVSEAFTPSHSSSRSGLKSWGDRAFWAAAPELRNSLVFDARAAQTRDQLKARLKTHSFSSSQDVFTSCKLSLFHVNLLVLLDVFCDILLGWLCFYSLYSTLTSWGCS